MRSALHTLKELVLTIIKQPEKPGTLTLLTKEAEHLPDTIIANTLRLSTNEQVQDYLFWQQGHLIQSADLLYKACLDQPRLILKKGLVVVLNILQALKRMFPKQFDNTLPLPQAAYLRQKTRYQAAFERLTRRFQQGGISEPLAIIALYPVDRFLQGSRPARYCDEHYLSRYVPVLDGLHLEGPDPAAAENLLCTRLITANFNSLAFLDYLTTRVHNELETVPLKKDKEIILKRLKIWLKPIPLLSGLALDKHFTPLKQTLLDWTELQQEALCLLPDTPKKAGTAQHSQPFKLTCSVPVIAYFTRLGKIHRIFPKERQHAEVVDHMVAAFCTKETERTSRNSFYNCYKSPSTNAALALRKILRPILEDIDHLISKGEVRESGPDPEVPQQVMRKKH